MKTLVLSLKNIVWGVTSCNTNLRKLLTSPPPAPTSGDGTPAPGAAAAAAAASSGVATPATASPLPTGAAAATGATALPTTSSTDDHHHSTQAAAIDPASVQRLFHRLTSEETYVFSKLFKNGLACFSIHTPVTNQAEEKEVRDSPL